MTIKNYFDYNENTEKRNPESLVQFLNKKTIDDSLKGKPVKDQKLHDEMIFFYGQLTALHYGLANQYQSDLIEHMKEKYKTFMKQIWGYGDD